MPPKASKIMIIRHAEKPTGQQDGVDESGTSSPHHLIVRGWQRAGALACFVRTCLRAGAKHAPSQASIHFCLGCCGRPRAG